MTDVLGFELLDDKLAPTDGIEPPPKASKAPVLPLYEAGIKPLFRQTGTTKSLFSVLAAGKDKDKRKCLISTHIAETKLRY